MVNDLKTDTVPVQVSDKGEKNMKYYGIPDWMYEGKLVVCFKILH